MNRHDLAKPEKPMKVHIKLTSEEGHDKRTRENVVQVTKVEENDSGVGKKSSKKSSKDKQVNFLFSARIIIVKKCP